MKTHTMLNLVIVSILISSLLGMPAPALATSQTSVQSAPFITCADVTEIPQAECEALVALYNSTDGPGWVTATNWLTNDMPCSWLGVYCGGYPSSHVTALDLPGYHLNGSIPSQLGDLTQITFLRLSNNQLSGSIPVELGDLSELQYLTLSNNQLNGSIPGELGNLTRLINLDIQNNQFTGSIPPQLGNLTQLTHLWLYLNQLSGSIPAELGNMTELQFLTASGNQLSGSIPPQFGNLTQLKNLDLANNQLSGNLPAELGNLTLLEHLWLQNNQLSGSIPAELGNLIHLRTLIFWKNQLTGNIPPALGNLAQLQVLELGDNQLSGSIPAELGNLTQLTTLKLFDNQLSGSIPPELGNLTQLIELSLQNNQLTGSIPPQLGNLTQLTDLALGPNQLSGGIPPELGNLTQLMWLSFWRNQLTGSIPAELGNLTQLTALGLNENLLSGEFPASITNLVNLTTLGFDCSLTSSDPVVIAFLQQKSNDCFPDPSIIVLLEDNSVYGRDWAFGTLLMLEIDDPTTPQSPDYTDSQVFVVSDGRENRFELNDIFEIQPGYLVTVSGGGFTKQLLVAHLSVTDVDIEADTVSGTGDPGYEIHVGRLCDDTSCTRRNIYVDANGNWFADFSVPGVDEEETVFDIRPGSGTGVYQIDEDNDATSVGWDVPNHTFGVRANDNQVEGSEWILGSTITIEIDDPATPANPDYTDTATVGLADWDPSQTYFRFNTAAYDLKLGDIVTVSDGDITKQLTVSNFRITDVNLNSDLVYGIASPGQYVNIWTCWQNDPCISRDETADQDGNWVTSFAVPGEQDWEQETADLRAGSWIDSSVNDYDGDSVMYGWYVQIPKIFVVDSHYSDCCAYNVVGGEQWEPGKTISLSIDDPSNGAGWDYQDSLIALDGQHGWANSQWTFNIDPQVFPIRAGYLVQVTDGTTVKEHVVKDLIITNIDLDADTVEGRSNSNEQLYVPVIINGQYAERFIDPDNDGHWLVDFSQPGQQGSEQALFDITPGTLVIPEQADEDGDATKLWWRAPNPRIDVRFHENEVHGYEWPLGTTVNLTIDDPDNGVGVDYTAAQTAVILDSDPSQTVVKFGLWENNFELENGQTVKMSDATTTKTLIVAAPLLKVIGDPSNTVEGTTEPYSEIWVDYPEATRHETADSTGHWLADFSVPGDEDFESQTISFHPYLEGEARVHDEDGDAISINWGLGRMLLDLDSNGHATDVYLRHWPGRLPITLMIDDPATSQNPDFTDVQIMLWSNGYSHRTMYWEGFDVQPGFTITATDGYTARTVLVPVLAITGYDVVNDTISGIAAPFARVRVVGPCSIEDCSNPAEPEVIADSNGNWRANFDDVQPGQGYEAQIIEPDWDEIVLRNWSVPVAWTLRGFYQPVDMNGVYNVVKGGSTVPLKFEILAGSTELTDITAIKSLTYTQISCTANAITDAIETIAMANTALRYDAASGQFIYNWKTPRMPGTCFRITVTTMDESSLVAYFKLK